MIKVMVKDEALSLKGAKERFKDFSDFLDAVTIKDNVETITTLSADSNVILRFKSWKNKCLQLDFNILLSLNGPNKRAVFFYSIHRKHREDIKVKNLEKMFDEALQIVAECIGRDKIEFIYRPITINTRAKKRWGMCRKSPDGRSRIEISKCILEDSVPYDATMSVLIHEILHACKDGYSHKGTWKVYASQVNAKYPKYNIERTASASIFGLEKEQAIIKKYAIQCQKCGHIHRSSKLSSTIKHPNRYVCNYCGGKMKRIQ